MKKRIYIILTCLALLMVAVIVVIAWPDGMPIPGISPTDPPADPKPLTVRDNKGQELICTGSEQAMYEDARWPYLEVVIQEAANILSEQKNISYSEAITRLFTEGYYIDTAFDAAACEALQIVSTRCEKTCDAACALTDLNGNLLAVTSYNTEDKQINHALERRSPYSSFKALSVYTPALEKGLACWSSLYQDSPYKQIENPDGTMRDWPSNATNLYTRKDISVYEALRQSVNTVAVKCLAKVGVQNSIDFLQECFGIPLKQEESAAKDYGEEEVIGSIALGYLEEGLTPVEMAGYYQIFANGGKYTAPKAITEIINADGGIVYIREAETKQVIRPATADTMNKLLQGVLAPGGTGDAITFREVEIAGKTGTGDDFLDNWFVGVTPGYSLAVWHGEHTSNQAAQLFSAAIRELYKTRPDANRKFVTHQNLQQMAYCVQSGHAFGPNCTDIAAGYFESADVLPECSTCKKP